jgi:hypothetical protein
MESETRTVWVAYTNSDCTEGRGYEIPIAVCEMECTAIRLGKGRHVQGSDGPVKPIGLINVGGQWYAPLDALHIVKPSREDLNAQKQLNARREALEKAKAAGLSCDDIAALRS